MSTADCTEGLPGPGSVLAGRYVVEDLVGRGGMGVVFAVRHVSLGTRFAVKLMLPDVAADEELSVRFLREARAASAITSDHVVKIFDVGRLDDGSLFIVMELLRGHDLEHELRARGSLPADEVARYGVQISDALAEAHLRGIVHRDLKPANLFLVDRGPEPPLLKILDFGISKTSALDRGVGDEPTLTVTDATLGSPKYMSPEQLRSPKHVDGRSDMWSVGVILYRALTGRLPFTADTLGEYITKVLTDRPDPFTDLDASIPKELRMAVSSCLVADLARRCPGARAMLHDLSPLAREEAHTAIARLASLGMDRDAFEAVPPSAGSATTIVLTTSPRPVTKLRRRYWLGSIAVGAVTLGAVGLLARGIGADAPQSSQGADSTVDSPESLPGEVSAPIVGTSSAVSAEVPVPAPVPAPTPCASTMASTGRARPRPVPTLPASAPPPSAPSALTRERSPGPLTTPGDL